MATLLGDDGVWLLRDLDAVIAAIVGRPTVAVSELFGPGRVSVAASHMNLAPGTAMDIRTGFDFSDAPDRVRASAIR